MLTDYSFMQKILKTKKVPTIEEMNHAINILKNTQLMSIRPRDDDVRYEWIKKGEHSYCVDNDSIFVFTNDTDMHRFAVEMLHWTEEEIEKGIPQTDICSFSEAREYAGKDVLIDCQIDSEKGFFVYNNRLGVWCVHRQPS